mgnify:CR=1 FL=1
MSQNKPKDWKMSDRERKESKRINLLFNANHSKAKHSEMVRRELKTLKKGGVDRMAEAFAVADSKAIQLHELLVRLVAMTNDPSKRHLQARIIGFDRQMREGAFEDLSFIQEAFLMGAEVGADADLRKVVEQTSPEAQRKNAESGFDSAMKKRDHKRRKTPGAEAQYPKETIQKAVAKIKRRVKDSKGKLTMTQAAKDVRESMMLFKVEAEYLRRECYERKGAKHTAGNKIAHR